MAFYVANLLQEEKSKIEREKLARSEIAPRTGGYLFPYENCRKWCETGK